MQAPYMYFLHQILIEVKFTYTHIPYIYKLYTSIFISNYDQGKISMGPFPFDSKSKQRLFNDDRRC